MKYFLSLLFYRVLFLLLLPLLLPVLVVRSKNHPEYRQRLSERLGFIDKNLNKNGIVIHAASVGEVIALKAFIEKLLVEQPSTPVTVTTFTPTGSAQVKKLFADRVQHCYLPIDSFICTWLFLSRLQPKAIVFMETELWPNLIAQCKNRGCKLLLVNGRLSTKSMKSYRKLNWLISPSLNAFNQILTQSQVNQNNFEALGGESLTCELSGNLKFDISITPSILNKQAELQKFIEGTRKLWVIASTHPGDEVLILNVFKRLYQQQPELLLVIVPRHPERFQEVADLSINEGFSTCKRSNNTQVDTTTKVWIVDTLGELMPVCALADIVTMGGSFSHIGGHNPLEPALFKKPIIVGPDMNNFSEVMEQLTEAKGIIQLSEIDNENELVKVFNELLSDNNKNVELGENAYNVVLQNQGASDRSLVHLNRLIDGLAIKSHSKEIVEQNNMFCIYDANEINDFSQNLLDSHYWEANNNVVGTAQGRGTTWFIAHGHKNWVLKHYYRGGLIGKFNKDAYLFSNNENTRATKEFGLLNQLRDLNLPAPKPIACRVIKNGLFYTADILTERVCNAQDLISLLIEQRVTICLWKKIGETIRAFHDHNVYHHDLNIHNILIDDKENVWLIDFDQGEIRTHSSNWKAENMSRLLRSFKKEKTKLATLNWQENEWDLLLKGYVSE